MKTINRIGNILAVITGVLLAWFILSNQPGEGYTQNDRRLMDDVFIAASYDARKVDIQANITPLFTADLEIK